MKYRESGMPEETMWQTFFNPVQVLDKLEVDKKVDTLLDIGCGYGTFLLPAAGLVSKMVIGIDIEKVMLEVCQRKIEESNIHNIITLQGDISSDTTIKKLKAAYGEIDYICMFNILHCEAPIELLRSAYRLLNANGRIGVIHWKYEDTPRGPSMGIRPTPKLISEWAEASGFHKEKQIELPPYHYGLIFRRS